MASAVRGMRVVYDKEGIDPGERREYHTPHFHQRRRRPLGRLHNRTGQACQRQALASGKPLSRTDRTADGYLKRHGPPSEAVVVAVTKGRLDGFALLTRTFGTWERIFQGQAERLARES